MNKFESFMNALIDFIGYERLLVIKDISILLSGILLSAIFLLFRVGSVMYHINKVETLNKTMIFSFKGENNEDITFANPKNTKESVVIMSKLMFSGHFFKRKYLLRDKKRTSNMIRLLIILASISVFIALFLNSFSILPVDDHYEIFWRFINKPVN